MAHLSGTLYARTIRSANGFAVELASDRGFSKIVKTFGRGDKSKPQPADKCAVVNSMRYSLIWISIDRGVGVPDATSTPARADELLPKVE